MAAEVVVGAVAVSGAAVGMWWSVAADRGASRQAANNLRAGLATVTPDAVARAAPGESVGLVQQLGDLAGRLIPTSAIERLNGRITRAGMSATWPVDRTLAMKVLLGSIGVFVGFVLLSTGSAIAMFYGLIIPILLFFGPDLILRTKGRERQKQIRGALPDTLDQITVCVEAGLGFEAAMARAARTGSGPLADEIIRTLQDVQLGVARKEALRGLSERNGVDELRQFVQAIIQAEGYGVPIARVLRIQAAELRDKRQKSAEEKAMKVSIKLLFPLILCILPCVFIVMIGPAILRLVDTLGGGL